MLREWRCCCICLLDLLCFCPFPTRRKPAVSPSRKRNIKKGEFRKHFRVFFRSQAAAIRTLEVKKKGYFISLSRFLFCARSEENWKLLRRNFFPRSLISRSRGDSRRREGESIFAEEDMIYVEELKGNNFLWDKNTGKCEKTSCKI